MGFVGRVHRGGRIELKIRDGPRNINTASERHRFAVIDTLGLGKQLHVTLDQSNDIHQCVVTLLGRASGPGIERCLCRFHGEVDIAII